MSITINPPMNKSELERMYTALGRTNGTASSKITYASTTIDEVLYGENGAWRGTTPVSPRTAKK